MGYSVSSSFISKLSDRGIQAKRRFMIGTSDYTHRVLKWPKISRTANEFTVATVNIPLANNGGEFNTFYAQRYTITADCTLAIGLTLSGSEDEYVTIYTGKMDTVRYPKEGQIEIKLRDKLIDFTQRKIGDSDAPIDFGSQIPSDIAWTLCTCYGGMDSTSGTGNTDIDFTSFLAWAAQFSQDNVMTAAHYEGEKVSEALVNLGKMTDSAIWLSGGNKIYFHRFNEPSSLDTLLTRAQIKNLQIDIEKRRLINALTVGWDYSVASDYWASTVLFVSSLSVNSYGRSEDVLEDETIWFCDSASALATAQRLVAVYQYPPRRFTLGTVLAGIQRDVGETIRFVNSFYSINSGTGWRIKEMEYDMEDGTIKFGLDESITGNAFYLDYSDLDGEDLLL